MSRPHLTPGKDPVPIVKEAGWASGPVWAGAENLATPPGYICYMRNIWMKLELYIRHIKVNCCFIWHARQLRLHHQHSM